MRGGRRVGIRPASRRDLLACRQLLDEGLVQVRAGQLAQQVATEAIDRLVAMDEIPPPGFGHRFHTRDPRAARLLQLALELEVDNAYTQMLRAFERALAAHPALQDRSLSINIDGATAALCGDIGFLPE